MPELSSTGPWPTDVAPRDEALRAALRVHLDAHLGTEPYVLGEKRSFAVELDLLIYPPVEGRPFTLIATAGMSDRELQQSSDSTPRRRELLIAVPEGWPGIDPLDPERILDETNFWPIRLLKDMAHTPFRATCSIAWGDTLANEPDEPLIAGRFGGAVVGPPNGLPASIMRAETPRGPVDLFAVIPVTPEELDYKLAMPAGGFALVDRLFFSGVTMVVDPTRDTVAAPPPWAVHLVLTGAPKDLAEALQPVLPGHAASLRQGSYDAVLPAGDTDSVRFRLSGFANQPAFGRDLERAGLDVATLKAIAASRHTITLAPERAGDGDQLAAVFAMLTIVLERGDVAAVWFPEQGRVVAGAELAKQLERGERPLFAVHPAVGAALDGAGAGATGAASAKERWLAPCSAVTTRGLAAYGGLEVRFEADDENWSFRSLERRLTRAVERLMEDSFEVPRAGQQARYGTTSYELHEGVDPVSGEPVLKLLEAERGPSLVSRLFRRKQ